jgi:hypothetical protein
MSEESAPTPTSLEAPWWATYRISVDDEAIEYRRNLGTVTPQGDTPITVEIVQRDELTLGQPGAVSRGPAQLSIMGRWLNTRQAHHLALLIMTALTDITDSERHDERRLSHGELPGDAPATTISCLVNDLTRLTR